MKFKRFLALVGAIGVGSIVLFGGIFAIVIAIPRSVTQIDWPAVLGAIAISLTFFALVGWFMWSIRYLERGGD